LKKSERRVIDNKELKDDLVEDIKKFKKMDGIG